LVSETYVTPEEPEVPLDAGTTIPQSPYELVVVAAQEARRLNERWRRAATDRTEKVTKTAVDRVLAGQVRFLYERVPHL
jgi:DNA-directed RNA polymerase subunit K/omega